MSVPRSIGEILQKHVTLEVESIDRMYLNLYQPRLQTVQGVVGFFRCHRKEPVASSTLMDPISKRFIAELERYAEQHNVELFTFPRDQRKDDVAAMYRARFQGREGVLFIGKAQEKVKVCRTERRINPANGKKFPWIVQTTAMVNQYYVYAIDEDFGPFFIKFCSYFPYNAKVCINGHEYVKRQLAKEGIAFAALDNGIRSCANPQRLQQLCDELDAAKIDALARKWLQRLPHPFTAADQEAGFVYDISILQAEFSLTQVLDCPRHGRQFFEEVIRENLHCGRPDRVQLIFNRRVTKRTPGVFRTRVLTEGVTPSLHVDYKHSRIKQYHKEGRALRTETTINNTRDFDIGKRLCNLPALREIGFSANRRLLNVQQVSQDCAIGEDAFRQLNEPVVVEGQRGSALRFGNAVTQTLLGALLVFRLLPRGFSNRALRDHWAPLLGTTPDAMTQGQMSYHLRRLRLHGLIERLPKTHRYRLTDRGVRIATFVTRTYTCVLRPGLALSQPAVADDHPLSQAYARLDQAIDHYIAQQKVPA
jgi:hypothetical protein